MSQWGFGRHVAFCLLPSALVLATTIATQSQQAGSNVGRTYVNPLSLVSTEHGSVENCSDPEVLEGEDGDAYWYLYCTSNPLRADNRDENGDLGWHLVPMFRSLDLANWDYVGDAFDRDPATATPLPPASADPTAEFWAPEVQRIGEHFYLFVTMTNTSEAAGGGPDCSGDSSIGYAVSDGPLGPWRAAQAPLIAPRRSGEDCSYFWTIDPEVFEDLDGQSHVLYGGASGGIEARELLVVNGGLLTASQSTAVPITIGNRWSYEGAEVIYHDGFYFLFASGTYCCNGPQTGYGAFVGRSESPTGPFVDRQGASFLNTAVGGTPVIAQNGNRWIGPGHNVLVQDRSGQWWTLYHAIDEDDPYFAGMTGFTKRPVLLDRIDWINGWPVLNGGAGPSDTLQAAPALWRGELVAPTIEPVHSDQLSTLDPSLSDEFEGADFLDRWDRVHQPGDGTVALSEGLLRFETQAGELRDDKQVSVLRLDAPDDNFVVETQVRLIVLEQGCCSHGLQAGLVVQGDDENYIKLVVIRVQETWQIEFARKVGLVPEGYPSYGNTTVGPPGEDWTWLRLAVRRLPESESYTAFTSRDGVTWVRGGTWNHALGEDAHIGLVAMGGEGFTAEFDYVRVYGSGG